MCTGHVQHSVRGRVVKWVITRLRFKPRVRTHVLGRNRVVSQCIIIDIYRNIGAS